MAQAPQPTWLKKLKGNPGKRALNTAEPTPKYVPWLEHPEHFDEERRRAWNGLTKELSTLGILATCDRGALERYVEFFVLWRQCRDYIEKNLKGKFSYVVRGPGKPARLAQNGTVLEPEVLGPVRYLKSYSEYKTLMELSGQLLRIEDRFGLSPSARTRIELEDHDNDGDDDTGDGDFSDLDD